MGMEVRGINRIPAMKSSDFLPIISSMSGIKPEPRVALLARGEVSWQDQYGFSHDEPARIEDRSLSGVCIRVKSPIHVGSEVKVKWRWDSFSGIARYCRPDQGEYVIGIQRFTKDMQMTALRTDPVRERPSSNAAPLKIVEKPVAPKPQESEPRESSPIKQAVPTAKSGNVPVVPRPPAPVAMVPREIGQGHTMDSANSSREPQSEKSAASGETEPPIKQPSPGKGRRHMSTKWLDTALGRQKQDDPEPNTNGTSVPGSNHAPAQKSAPEKVQKEAATMGPVKAQGDLQSMEDIYRAAGILNPRMGYSINKVVEMLGSEHIRTLPTEAKRAAVLMALDAAGVSMNEVLKDASLRQEALDQYENDQRKYFEEYWERKIASNAQIQAELDRVSAQYQERIDRNLEEVTQEKVVFTRWQRQKEQEAERMTEAVELCSKTAPSGPAAPVAATGSSVLALREVGSIVKS
jgi:hypothetical protein